jgi:N-methylhydantoinase A
VGVLADSDLAAVFGPAEQSALAELGPQHAGAALLRYAELRYRGQEHTLEVPVPASVVEAGAVAGGEPRELRDAFEQRCLETYSFRLDAPLEIVSVRVTATAPVAGQVRWDAGTGGAEDGQAGSRLVDLDPYGEPAQVPVLPRDQVGADPVTGPCVIEEVAATTLVLPGQQVSADELGNLVIEEQS